MSLRNIVNEQSRQINRLEDILSRFYSSAVSVRGDFPSRPQTTSLAGQAPEAPTAPDLEAQLANNSKRLDSAIDQADYLASKLFDALEGESGLAVATKANY